MKSELKNPLLSPHFWLIAVLLAATTISHYHELLQNVPVIGQITTGAIAGLSRHTVDRLIYVLLVAYSCWAFGTKAAIGVLAITFVAMLPRAIVISPNPADAVLETAFAMVIAVLVVSLLAARRRIREDRDRLGTAMAELRSSEERYRELFQNASDAIWTHDLDGRMTVANQACEKMTGYTVDELLGRRVTEFLSKEAHELAKEVKRKLLSGEPLGERYEQRIFRRDGTEAVMELATRLIIQDGKPVAFHNIARDITEEKRAEEALRESERELSQIVDGSTVPIFVINKRHTLTHWNKACEKLTGVPASEVVGTNRQWKAFYPSERPVMADLIVDFVADNVPEDVIAQFYHGKYDRSALIPGAYEAEDFFPHIGDGGKWLFFTAAPLRDKDGKVFGAIETLQDMTERKRIERELKDSESRYRDLFNSASEAIIISSMDGDVIEVNPAASALTGYALAELKEMNVREFLTPESLAVAIGRQLRLLRGETGSERYEQRILRSDGTEAIVELATGLITLGGEPVAWHNIARDVTEERRMQANLRYYLQQITRAQEEERKRIARDLHDDTRQSLLLLAHRLDSLASDPKSRLSAPVRDRLVELYDLTVKTIDDLQRYAQELRPAILDDLGLTAALEWMADKLLTENGMEVDLRLDRKGNELPHEVQLLLFRIAQEAMGNIRKHAHASKVVVGLKLREGKARMTVTDNGRGFKVPERLGDLSGDGKLGLVGMQERVQLLRGTIDVASRPTRGTSVTVEVPIEG